MFVLTVAKYVGVERRRFTYLRLGFPPPHKHRNAVSDFRNASDKFF